MKNQAFRYVMLLTSLPGHPADLFAAQRPPISRIQLDNRLSMLSADHAEQLAVIEHLMYWRNMEDADDQRLLAGIAKQAARVTDPCLQDLIAWRLRIRMLIAALRAKVLMGSDYDANRFQGLGADVLRIRRHWREPDFGFGNTMPWIAQAKQMLESGESYALERLILGMIWQHYVRKASDHHFDFAAVVLYVLRWDIIQRWSTYDSRNALTRFDDLVNAAIHPVHPASADLLRSTRFAP